MQDCGVSYLGVLCEEERFAQYYGEGAVAFEGEEEFVSKASCRGPLGWNDAEVLVVRFHEYVAAPEVNLVCAYVALDDQEPVL